MVGESAEGDAIKAALVSGKASTSTIAALRTLLEVDTPTKQDLPVAVARKKTAAPKPAAARTGRKATCKPNKSTKVPILEDRASQLSEKAKYALATETVNAALKVLSDVVKSREKCIGDVAVPATPSERPLKARSANSTPSPKKSTLNAKSTHGPISNLNPVRDEHIRSAAQCAHLSFSFLRTISSDAPGIRAMPKYQLENGMLALASKLIGHEMFDLAIVELKSVKRSLERAISERSDAKQIPANEQLDNHIASLLHFMLSARLRLEDEDLCTVINYFQQVLKLLTKAGQPRDWEKIDAFLSMDYANNYVCLIERHGRFSGDFLKSKKQLDSLASTLLGFCPSIASSADKVAQNPNRSVSPQCALRLQTLALRIQQRALQQTGETSNGSQNPLAALFKCMSAFVRRRLGHALDDAELLQECFEAVMKSVSGDCELPRLDTYFLICSIFESAAQYDKALHWLSRMELDFPDLGRQDSRGSAIAVKRAIIRIRQSHSDVNIDLENIYERLAKPLTGNSQDCELLLVSLSDLLQVLPDTAEQYPNGTKLIWLAAGFVQRYARSYADRDSVHLQPILLAALRRSKTSDSLLSWITVDAAAILIRGGALKAVADGARTAPLSNAWAVSPAAVWLGRVLRALMLKALRAENDAEFDSLFEGEKLANDQRGAVLEWVLNYLLELAPRPKYHSALKSVVPNFLRRLSKIYNLSVYPIRRARVASLTFLLRECQPDLIAPHVSATWKNAVSFDVQKLGQDVGLQPYYNDIDARLLLFQLFSGTPPTYEDVQPILCKWQHIVQSTTVARPIQTRVDDLDVLVKQLRSTAAYFSMQEHSEATLSILKLVVDILASSGDTSKSPIVMTTMTDIARLNLRLGYSERAGSILAMVEKSPKMSGGSFIDELYFLVVRAEYLSSIGKAEECNTALDTASEFRATISRQNIAQDDGRRYETLHAHAWLIQSKHLLATGAPHEALSAAKHSVRILNGVWTSLERAETYAKAPATNFPDTPGDTSLTKGISKLNLTPQTGEQDAIKNMRGASFWPLVPMLCQALLLLSDVFAHHGRFLEATYYSDQALKITKSSRSSILYSRARSHRSRLLTLAGQLEEAELCLAEEEAASQGSHCLAAVESLRARAVVKMKDGDFSTALELYRQAEEVLRDLQSDTAEIWSRVNFSAEEMESNMKSLTLEHVDPEEIDNTDKLFRPPNKSSRKPKPPAENAATTKGGRPRSTVKPTQPEHSRQGTHSAVSRLREELFAEKTLGILRCRGAEDIGEIESLETDSRPASLQSNPIRVEMLLHRATSMIEQDVTLNILTESTLATPAILAQQVECAAKSPAKLAAERPIPKASRKTTTTAKATRRDEDSVEVLLEAARKHHADAQATNLQLCSTAHTHSEFSTLAHVSSLQSALPGSLNRSSTDPVVQAFEIDFPRSKALEYEERAIAVNKENSQTKEVLAWPSHTTLRRASHTMTAHNFQQEFIDIIPGSWTAVSLCLSENCKDLYIARYRSGQQPLVLKLPFARHKPEGSDDDAFDFAQGKAELQEILGLSNYTCHNSGDVGARGAKTKWWDEREALDKRLHELLINIENIWFGGFKGVFSQYVSLNYELSRFRKAFDIILTKYLPSRRSSRGKSNGLALNDQILELFVGLGSDDATQDMDEPLADLLYFVVDLLQFNGERNAYDEIDFDSMVVEVSDALQAHHDTCDVNAHQEQHLILVLDRRLQTFPWESMPCLQSSSVSRVGSMRSLREQILAMRSAKNSSNVERHVVGRASGTYILNPSSDLAATQAKLQPPLETLQKSSSSSWKCFVSKAPTEEDFISSLKTSTMLLYFGHGPGTQYIRPRAIASLDHCSEVVWLMGCSSGAVEEYGELEPFAVPLTYLLAGKCDESGTQEENKKCMAVVATLWDVTDKDIDRFSIAVGEEWGLWPAMEPNKIPAKTPRKRQILAVPSTPNQLPKTAKTPKVVKTAATSKTPARRNGPGCSGGAGTVSLVEAVRRSRDACYLRYLNGAAPVVYGVPVYLGD